MNEQCVFEKKDYESSDGMLTYVWGPSLWHFLHTMSFNYPVKPSCEDKLLYMKFVKSLKVTLPCRYCRENLDKNLKETGFSIKDMRNRDTFSRFMYDLHNHINIMLGKKNSLTYEEVRERYENFRSICKNKKDKKVNKPLTKKQIQANLSRKISLKDKKCLEKGKVNEVEKGCVTPIQGIKSKCIIRIVPKTSKKATFMMDPKCKAKRLTKKKQY